MNKSPTIYTHGLHALNATLVRHPRLGIRLSPHASGLPPCAPQARVIKEHGVEALTEQRQSSQSEDVLVVVGLKLILGRTCL